MHNLERYFPWLLFTPVLVPLVFWQGLMYPLVTPKTLLLRGSVLLALALFAYLASRGTPFYFSRLTKPVTWIPGLFLALAYLASLAGVDFAHSFWSTFERGDGLLTLTACVVSFYLFLLSAREDWLMRLLRVVAWVGSIAAVYLFVQWFAIQYHLSIPFVVPANGRIGGTMGNAAFLAAYLGMSFFAVLAMVRGAPRARRVWGFAAVLHLGAILVTSTRGTILALALVGTLFAGFYAFTSHGRIQTVARVALGTLLLLVAAFFLFREPLSRSSIEPVRRLASISFSETTVASRLFLSEHIAKEALNRPLLGYGAELITIPFNTVFDPAQLSEEWFDRSHNAYLDTFVQYGFLGPLLYLALIGLLLQRGWRLFARARGAGLAVVGMGGVYAIQNIFVFDTAATLWLFLSVLALAMVTEQKESARRPLPLPKILGLGLSLVLVGALVPVVLTPLRANAALFEAYQYEIVDLERSERAAERARNLGSYADLELGYNTFFIYTDNQRTSLTGADLERAYRFAVATLSTNLDRYPYDARTAVYLAQVIDAAPEGVEADQELLKRVIARALELSPKRAQPWYLLVNMALEHGNQFPKNTEGRQQGYTAAREILERYITLVPKLSTPHFVLAQLLYASGDTKGAAVEAEKGRLLYTSSLEGATRAVEYYETVHDLPHARFFLEEVLYFDPNNAAAREDLDTITSYERNTQ